MVLVRSDILGQFVNILTADYKCSRLNRESVWQQVPRHVSRQPKTFSGFFDEFLKSTLHLEYFEKKDQSYSLSINEIDNCETGSYLNVQKAIFHAKLPQITCYRVPNTAEISTKPVSYQSSINLS